jgi:hypothetical protein
MKRMLAFALGLAVIAGGCSDPVAPATPTPAPATTTDAFTGTLTILGSNTHQFTVNQIGAIQVSVDSIVPGAAVGVGVGTPSGANCLLIQNLTAVAGANAQISGTATITGTFCISVFDVGNLVESVAYAVTVKHS